MKLYHFWNQSFDHTPNYEFVNIFIFLWLTVGFSHRTIQMVAANVWCLFLRWSLKYSYSRSIFVSHKYNCVKTFFH